MFVSVSLMISKLKLNLFFIYWLETGEAQQLQQQFTERPLNTSVREGQMAILRCKVANQQGRAQWTKDGFALGMFFFVLSRFIIIIISLLRFNSIVIELETKHAMMNLAECCVMGRAADPGRRFPPAPLGKEMCLSGWAHTDTSLSLSLTAIKKNLFTTKTAAEEEERDFVSCVLTVMPLISLSLSVLNPPTTPWLRSSSSLSWVRRGAWRAGGGCW